MDCYTVEFPTETWVGARRLILRDGFAFGDPDFVYFGAYNQVKHVVYARLHIIGTAGQFEMIVTGTLQGNAGAVVGVIRGIHAHDQLTGKITREGEPQPYLVVSSR
jgi:hypothetical protein